MRVKRGREWVEAGPGRAVKGRSVVAENIGGRPVGYMVADHISKDPLPLKVSDAIRHPNPLGMKRLPGR